MKSLNYKFIVIIQYLHNYKTSLMSCKNPLKIAFSDGIFDYCIIFMIAKCGRGWESVPHDSVKQSLRVS